MVFRKSRKRYRGVRTAMPSSAILVKLNTARDECHKHKNLYRKACETGSEHVKSTKAQYAEKLASYIKALQAASRGKTHDKKISKYQRRLKELRDE